MLYDVLLLLHDYLCELYLTIDDQSKIGLSLNGCLSINFLFEHHFYI